MTGKKIVLSVDFELFSHTYAFRKAGCSETPENNGEEGIETLLDIFEANDVTTTFFVVGELAWTCPELIEKISEAGHEIASHSLTHVSFKNLTEEEMRNEIFESKRVLERTSGQRIKGFRASAFQIQASNFHLLEDAGYEYDSSVIPCRNIGGWYGNPDMPIIPTKLSDIFNKGSDIMEFPVATNPRLKVPVSGFWMRLFGVRHTMLGIKELHTRGAVPVLYIHPWELVDLPKIKGIPWRVYFRTGFKTFEMIKHIIKNVDADFVPIKDLEVYDAV